MMMAKALLIIFFVLPIAGLSLYFIAAASRMAREEAERERIRRQSEQAQRYDRRRRRARYIAASARTGVCR